MFGRERIPARNRVLKGKRYPDSTRSRWEIPVMAGLVREPENLELDPYLLGCWLGDGTSNAPHITSMDPEIVASFEDAFGAARAIQEQPGNKSKTYSFGGLRQRLSRLDVLGNKHVPPQYLRGSSGQRLALLQGLCDTDGGVGTNGCQQDFATTLPALRDAFVQLVFSLGGHATVCGPTQPYAVTTLPDGSKHRAPGKPSWRVFFRLPAGMRTFRLERKLRKLRADSGRNAPRKRIARIEMAGRGPGTCFTVDAPDHLFCAGREYIVSHNTSTGVHALIRELEQRADRRNAYATYNQHRAARVQRGARLVAQRAGLRLSYRVDDWTNEQTGGGLLWASRHGGFTGEGVDGILLIDDILKDRREASSALILDECKEWFDDVASSRCHPRASIIVMATRWSKRDLSGVLIERGWPYYNMQAIADGEVDDDGYVVGDPFGRKLGDVLCEERQTKEQLLERRRVNAFSFVSLYQGAPRPRGGTVFEPARYYDALPTERYRVGYGVDLAYSKKKTADFSAAIELWRYDPPRSIDDPTPKPIYYVVDVKRAQVRAPEFTLTLHSMQRKRRGPMRWYASGVELGSADFIKKKVPALHVKAASDDKLIRAQPVSEAWNDGRVLVPSRVALGLDPDDLEIPTPEWVDDFVDEIENFTGVADAYDDQCDALAAGFDELERAGTSDDRGGPGNKQRTELEGGGF
jgi:phage terminase large subunit-like protein